MCVKKIDLAVDLVDQKLKIAFAENDPRDIVNMAKRQKALHKRT